jgi:hypothetical protein
MSSQRFLTSLTMLAIPVFGGCGSEPAPPPKPAGAAKPAGPPASPVAQLAARPPMGKEELLAEVRKRQLGNEDFVEGESNRDPFRSYLATFAAQPAVNVTQHKIVLQKFGIDELKLVAIVSGEGIAPRAMFVDPSGKGFSIVRGDHVSKLDALVTRVSPDRVFFEWEEDQGGGKSKKVDRVVELHAGEVQAQ